MNRPLMVILAAATLDAIGIGLIFPILPSLLREVTGSGEISLLYGVMLAVYALMQFVFAPVLGALSDRFGRRPVLLISIAGAAIDYVIMAYATDMWVLFAGRAVAGLTAANMAVATAYITDISSKEKRARRFGYMHACFGVGFIIGPILGGVLGDYWVRAPFVAAAVLNGLTFVFALIVLPESRKGSDGNWDIKSLNPLIPLRWAFSFKALLPLMLIYLVINFVGQTYGTIWVLFGEDRFAWNGMMVGLSLAGYGLFHAGAQTFLTGPAVERLGERNTLLIGMSFEALACIVLAFAFRGWIAFAILPIFAVAGIGMPALQSMLTAHVDSDHQGRLQGVLSSLVSLSAIFGPLIFSALYFWSREGFNGLVWIAGAVIYFVCMPVVLRVKKAASTS